MSTRLTVLNHVLEVLQFQQGVIDAIKGDASVGLVGLLTNIDGDQFLKLEGVKHSHTKSVDLFKLWFQEFMDTLKVWRKQKDGCFEQAKSMIYLGGISRY